MRSCEPPMTRLVPVVNKLHNIFQRCGLENPIDLPQIVVVGAQSSGKSSVLEAIVGLDFLPRGAGVVTRSPILIQLNKLQPLPSDVLPAPMPWVEFLHLPEKKFVSELEIQAEIIRETERVAVDLTLIDLPGLTKVPVGDQPPDIEKLVRAMIHSYIEKPNTIILAVHPANTDLPTSDSLQMARRVDPHGLRTLGVITKLDLMDSGTNALDMLLGRVIPLRRGYVGVVNRSQADLDKHATIEQSRAAEKAFFKSHPVYTPHASKMGSQYLSELLSSMLMEHIRTVLPSIRSSLNTQLADVRLQLTALGPELTGPDDASGTLLHLLTNYASAFCDAIDGRPHAQVAITELAGGARISYIFHDKFGHDLAQMDPFESLGTDQIRTALRNATGHRTPLFIPEAAFEMLVKRQINMFLEPSLSCVDMVYDELTRLAETVESIELARFQRLRIAVSESTLKLLRERKAPTIEMIHNLIAMELSYINTWHPDFVGAKEALGSVLDHVGVEKFEAKSFDTSLLEAANDSVKSGSGRSGRERSAQRSEMPDAWVEKNLLGHETGGVGIGGGQVSRTNMVGNRRRGMRNGTARGLQDGINVENSGVNVMKKVSILNSSHVRMLRGDTMTEDERQEVEILQRLLESYFNIVRKRMQDMVPKAIIAFLVQKSKESLQSMLVSKLYKPNTVAKLMVEGDETCERRKDMKELEKLLELAVVEVNEIRDVH